MIEQALFLAAVGCAVLGACGAAVVRNLFHAALLLGLCLVGTAGLYLFLHQYYLACLQVVVYLGGVLVLVLFATLFSADVMGQWQRTALWLRLFGALGAAGAAAMAVGLARLGGGAVPAPEFGATPGPKPLDAIAGPEPIGDLLLGPWLVPFLLAGFLLTVALVVAVATVAAFRTEAARA
jgi:NADH:ubiquinone oxidoreductase subunit 6 (subunit J)